MNFFNKLIDIFSPIDEVQINLVDYQFVMTSSRKSKSIPAKRLASNSRLSRYITENALSNEPDLLLTCSAARRLYDDASRGAFTTFKPTIIFANAAANIQFKELQNEWVIEYTFDQTTGMLHRTLPSDAIELAPGYFFINDVIWWLADPQIVRLSHTQNVEGADILSFTKLVLQL